MIHCGSKTQTQLSKLEKQTPNIAYIQASYKDVWEKTLETIQYEFLYEMEIQDFEKGFFSTKMIFDQEFNLKRRFRLSGNLSSNNQETMITLYKQEEIQNQNEPWQTNVSDISLEKSILDRILKKIQTP